MGQEVAGKFTAARQPPPLEAQAESPREGLPCCHITLNSPLRLRLWEVWDWQGKLGAGRLALSRVGGVCVCVHVCAKGGWPVPPKSTTSLSLPACDVSERDNRGG